MDFAIRFVGEVWPHLRAEFERREVELVTGVFGRKNERDHYASDHPLTLLWNAFIARRPPA
jgi:hypothetical protein